MVDSIFAGSREVRVPTPRGLVFARVGGAGPPLPLLHGYPETHLAWHAAAAAREAVLGRGR